MSKPNVSILKSTSNPGGPTLLEVTRQLIKDMKGRLPEETLSPEEAERYNNNNVQVISCLESIITIETR